MPALLLTKVHVESSVLRSWGVVPYFGVSDVVRQGGDVALLLREQGWRTTMRTKECVVQEEGVYIEYA